MIGIGDIDALFFDRDLAIELYVNKGRGYVEVGERPWHLAITPDGTRAIVANGASDSISFVDIAAMQVTATIKAGGGPWGVALGR